jgi:DNA ligase 1
MTKDVTMMTAADVIEALAATNSRLDKEAIIQSAFDAGCSEFFEGARMALDVMVTYGVKVVPESTAESGSITWAQFKLLADQLATRKLSGNAARAAIAFTATNTDAHTWNSWYRRILLQDLKCGVSEKTINSVLSRNGKLGKSWEVPVFSCQLAKSGDDHPKKMVGVKLCDWKLDGVRLLTVLQPNGDVTQFTRNGLQNKNFHHICDMLRPFAQSLSEAWVLDGEVVSENFQALMTQVNRKASVNTSDSSLALFDCVPLSAFRQGVWRKSQRERHAQLLSWEADLNRVTNGAVYVVPKTVINLSTPEGQAQYNAFNKDALARKYEGIMIKSPDAPYETKRSDAWLKVKPFQTFDLEIVAVEEGEGKFQGMMGALVCEGEDQGKRIRTNVGSGFSDTQRVEIWAARKNMLGRVVEIKGDALTMDQNQLTWSLRFPVFLQFRGHAPHEKI